MTLDRRNVVVAAITTVLVALSICWAGVRATEADRDFRSRRAEACAPIEDDDLLALCIIGGNR